MSGTSSPVYFDLYIQVRPNSRKASVDTSKSVVVVSTRSPPMSGKANREMLTLLAKFCRCDISSLKIISGITSPKKIVRFWISNNRRLEEILAKFPQAQRKQ